MIVVDTSAMVALVDRRDQHYRAAVTMLPPGDLVIPAGIMSELAFMVESRVGGIALDGVLDDIESGRITLDCGDGDIPRVRQLIQRYVNLPLGYSDASVIACAERLRAQVFTFDRRHFAVVAAGGTFSIVS